MPENEPAPGESPETGDPNINSGNATSRKPEPMPWETEPYIDRQAATARAINAAAQRPRTDTNSAIVQSYAQKAFDDEVKRVAGEATGARNGTLFKAAANLFELVAAGALTETDVVAALRDASDANGSIRDDGEAQFDRTLASARRRGFDNPRDLSVVGTRAGNTFAADSDDDEPKPLVFDDFRRHERDFWMRPSLQNIYLAALSRMCSPWAVFANCVVKALSTVRPHIVLPDIIGSRGSLNFFAAVVAKSGDGKSVAEDAASDLMPSSVVRQRNLGSGEGLVDAYVKPPDKETGEPGGLHESVMFVADEGDSLFAVASRSGATLPALLRSGFSGKQLGFSYRGNDRHLDAHSYRLTLVVNVQPARAGVLLDDQTGGLLQRFMWFPATDQRVDSQNPSWPGPLSLPPNDTWLYPRQLKIPYNAIELIKDGAVARNRGEPNPLDGHLLFAREKLAFALAVLDGRDTMTTDDWRLAGIAARVSDHTRQWCAEELDRARADDATKEGKTLGVKRFAADREQARQVGEQRTRIARSIADKLTAAGAEGLTVNKLARTLRSDERGLVVPALLWLAEHEKVKKIDRQAKDRTDRWAVQ